MFFDDAKLVSRELELTLTGKNCGLEERAPMCGVPFHSADTYIARLIEKGYRVAICEQTEDPATTKGLVKREVVQIVTPGTILSGDMLKENENNYLASVYVMDGSIGLSYCDISTGELCLTTIGNDAGREALINELTRIKAREILMDEETSQAVDGGYIEDSGGFYVHEIGEEYYRRDAGLQIIRNQFGSDSITGLGLEEGGPAQMSLAALLLYITDTQKTDLSHISHIGIYSLGDHMALDKATIRNLEITETLFEGKTKGSLLGVLDRTCTAMGSRTMKQWLREPLNDPGLIEDRLAGVDELIGEYLLRNDLRESLKHIYDFERLAGRLATGKANGRDLIALRDSCSHLPQVIADLSGCKSNIIGDQIGRAHV